MTYGNPHERPRMKPSRKNPCRGYEKLFSVSLVILAFCISAFVWVMQVSFAISIGFPEIGLQGWLVLFEGIIILGSTIIALRKRYRRIHSIIFGGSIFIAFVYHLYCAFVSNPPLLLSEEIAMFIPLLFPVLVFCCIIAANNSNNRIADRS